MNWRIGKLSKPKTECKAALNIAGEHYPCDQPLTDDGTHGGFAHGNREAQAIWCSEAADPPTEQVANKHGLDLVYTNEKAAHRATGDTDVLPLYRRPRLQAGPQ